MNSQEIDIETCYALYEKRGAESCSECDTALKLESYILEDEPGSEVYTFCPHCDPDEQRDPPYIKHLSEAVIELLNLRSRVINTMNDEYDPHGAGSIGRK